MTKSTHGTAHWVVGVDSLPNERGRGKEVRASHRGLGTYEYAGTGRGIGPSIGSHVGLKSQETPFVSSAHAAANSERVPLGARGEGLFAAVYDLDRTLRLYRQQGCDAQVGGVVLAAKGSAHGGGIDPDPLQRQAHGFCNGFSLHEGILHSCPDHQPAVIFEIGQRRLRLEVGVLDPCCAVLFFQGQVCVGHLGLGVSPAYFSLGEQIAVLVYGGSAFPQRLLRIQNRRYRAIAHFQE